MATNSHSPSWPGERDPSHHDVASASERPDPALLSDFRRVLLSSSDAAGSEKLFHMDLKDQEPATKKYTYPLALLSDFPKLPTDDRLTYLSGHFTTCSNHVFFGNLPIPALAREPIVPPLRFGMACLASVCAGGDTEEARNLFLAGSSLWPVMVEVDNGLARSVEMLLAAVLLVPYGVLAATEYLQRRATLILSSSITVARRMRLHQPSHLEPALRQRVSSYSSMLWSLWLWDIIHALRSNLPLTFSSNEISTTMPSSTLAFRDVYQSLLQESGTDSQRLLSTMGNKAKEQAVLLLLAILSDSITVRRSLGNAANAVSAPCTAVSRHDPFVPLSAHTELDRMQRQLSQGLDRWYGNFGGSMTPDVMTLFHYCRLYLSCRAIPRLPSLAEYALPSPSQAMAPSRLTDMKISSQSLSHAWALLDASAGYPKAEYELCPAWMPIAVFHAALVVWANTSFSVGEDGNRHESKRVLLAFRVELEAMHWPCCVDMAETLRRLMSS